MTPSKDGVELRLGKWSGLLSRVQETSSRLMMISIMNETAKFTTVNTIQMKKIGRPM